MSVTYRKLREMLEERDIAHIDLLKQSGVCPNVMTSIRRDQYISLGSIEKICKTLECKVDDILEFF